MSNKLRLGFDEIYVVAIDYTTLNSECIYDIDTANEVVKMLKQNGYEKSEVISLEYAFENNYCSR